MTEVLNPKAGVFLHSRSSFVRNESVCLVAENAQTQKSPFHTASDLELRGYWSIVQLLFNCGVFASQFSWDGNHPSRVACVYTGSCKRNYSNTVGYLHCNPLDRNRHCVECATCFITQKLCVLPPDWVLYDCRNKPTAVVSLNSINRVNFQWRRVVYSLR